MRQKLSLGAVVIAYLAATACTISQTETPNLTGPSTFATSVSVTATPDLITLGQSATALGQTSEIVVTVFDSNGQPKSDETVRLDTLVNGKLSDCGQLSLSTLRTGSDGRARSVFTAPGTPPDCPNFSTDGTVTIRATPVGTNFQVTSSASSSASVFMAQPASINPVGGFLVNFTISPNPGKPAPANVAFTDAGSVSPGNTITEYRWTWSDGATKLGPNVTHDFAAAGTYTATLRVTDNIGQVAFRTGLVTIEP